MKPANALSEPMVWLIFGIPLLTAIAGFFTLYIAFMAQATDVVNTPVTRIAQIQQTDLSADETAARAMLSAHLKISDGQWFITTQNLTNVGPLILELQHPISQERDQQLLFNKDGSFFVNATVVDFSHDWILQLSDSSHQWRLVGRLHKNQSAADLRASVSLP